MNDPDVRTPSDKKVTSTFSHEHSLQLNRRRLMLLFDMIIANEPDLNERVVDRVLDIARDEWMYHHIERRWVRVVFRGGSFMVRPLSRRVALRYIRDQASEAIVDAILSEILNMTQKRVTDGDSIEADYDSSVPLSSV